MLEFHLLYNIAYLDHPFQFCQLVRVQTIFFYGNHDIQREYMLHIGLGLTLLPSQNLLALEAQLKFELMLKNTTQNLYVIIKAFLSKQLDILISFNMCILTLAKLQFASIRGLNFPPISYYENLHYILY